MVQLGLPLVIEQVTFVSVIVPETTLLANSYFELCS